VPVDLRASSAGMLALQSARLDNDHMQVHRLAGEVVMKLSKNKRKILEWCLHGPRLETQFSASGLYNAVQDLRSAGLLLKIDHPTVKDAMGYPADAYEITEAGRAAVTEGASQ
jgi:hypothetical protein